MKHEGHEGHQGHLQARDEGGGEEEKEEEVATHRAKSCPCLCCTVNHIGLDAPINQLLPNFITTITLHLTILRCKEQTL